MVKYLKHLTVSSLQTKKLAELLSEKIIKTARPERAIVVGLEGELGSGKTTFAQGLAKGLGIKQKVLSPTFVIMKRFKIKDSRFENLYHIDCYRIKGLKEISELGFKKIISNPKNIIVIEWSGRIKKMLPKSTLFVRFKFRGKNRRKIVVE